MGNAASKICGAILSAVEICVGICLVAYGCPILGGTLISAGIQGCISVSQGHGITDGEFWKSQATGAATGLICGGAFAGAGAVAGSMNLLGSVFVYSAAGAAGGYISNGVGNVINGQNFNDNAVKAVVGGAVAGALIPCAARCLQGVDALASAARAQTSFSKFLTPHLKLMGARALIDTGSSVALWSIDSAMSGSWNGTDLLVRCGTSVGIGLAVSGLRISKAVVNRKIAAMDRAAAGGAPSDANDPAAPNDGPARNAPGASQQPPDLAGDTKGPGRPRPIPCTPATSKLAGDPGEPTVDFERQPVVRGLARSGDDGRHPAFADLGVPEPNVYGDSWDNHPPRVVKPNVLDQVRQLGISKQALSTAMRQVDGLKTHQVQALVDNPNGQYFNRSRCDLRIHALNQNLAGFVSVDLPTGNIASRGATSGCWRLVCRVRNNLTVTPYAVIDTHANGAGAQHCQGRVLINDTHYPGFRL